LIYGRELSNDVVDKLREHGINIGIEERGGFRIYHREGGFPEGLIEKIVKSSGSLIVYPVHSTQYEVSSFLLFRLKSPLVVAPRSSFAIYVKAPISVGIYVDEDNARRLIDFFGSSQFKYALYGSSASGVICRFYRTDVYLDAPSRQNIWEATTKISIENSSDEFVEVRNVVYPLLNADVYIDDTGNAYIEAAHLSIKRDGVGTVLLKNEAPFTGLKRCPQPFMGLLGKIGKFDMEFGL